MNSDLNLSVKSLMFDNPLMLFDLKGLDNLKFLNIVSTTDFRRPPRITVSLENLEEFCAKIDDDNVEIVLEPPKLLKFWMA